MLQESLTQPLRGIGNQNHYISDNFHHKKNSIMKAHTNTNSCGTVIFLKTLRLTTTALLPVIAKHYITVFKTWHDDLMKNRVKDFPATLATPKSGQCHIWQRNSRQHDKPSFWTCVDIWVSTDVKFGSVNLTFLNMASTLIKPHKLSSIREEAAIITARNELSTHWGTERWQHTHSHSNGILCHIKPRKWAGEFYIIRVLHTHTH